MSDASRQRRRRERERHGRGVLHPEVNLVAVAGLLHAEGYLLDPCEEGREALSHALGRYLDDVTRVTGHNGTE